MTTPKATHLGGREKRAGFTFIELLVVITIIAVLAGVAAVSYTNVSRNSRDTRRRLDIENIRSALELCRTETGGYPPGGIYDDITCGGEIYMNNTPRDPTGDEYMYVGAWPPTSYGISCVLESGEDCSFNNP